MKELINLFLEYYEKTYVVNGEVHFHYHKLPGKAGIVHCGNNIKNVRVDFNHFYEFLEKYQNCDFVTIENENYKITHIKN